MPFHIGDQFLEVLRRKILRATMNTGKAVTMPDRLEIDVGVGEVRIERDRGGVRAHLAHQQGVALRLGAHRPGRAGGATGAGDVLHNDLLAERARHVLSDDAADVVAPPAGTAR